MTHRVQIHLDDHASQHIAVLADPDSPLIFDIYAKGPAPRHRLETLRKRLNDRFHSRLTIKEVRPREYRTDTRQPTLTF